jgi:hypothetical protein
MLRSPDEPFAIDGDILSEQAVHRGRIGLERRGSAIDPPRNVTTYHMVADLKARNPRSDLDDFP